MTPTPNVELIRKVIDAITTQPEHFDMRCWSMMNGPDGWLARATEADIATLSCGMTLCMAGTVLALTGQAEALAHVGEEGYGDVEALALDALGLPDAAGRLFYRGLWPDAFAAMDEKVAAVKLLEMVAAGEDPWA